MRPIKFRAWDKQNRSFIKNVQDSCKSIEPNDLFYYFGEALADDNYEVEQYTGLKDFEGEQIYEGDIVHWYDGFYSKSNMIGIIKLTDGAFMVVNNNAYQFAIADEIPLCDLSIDDVEVLGNIHQNPELFEAVR